MKNQAYLSLGKRKDRWIVEESEQRLWLFFWVRKLSLFFEGSIVWSCLLLFETLPTLLTHTFGGSFLILSFPPPFLKKKIRVANLPVSSQPLPNKSRCEFFTLHLLPPLKRGKKLWLEKQPKNIKDEISLWGWGMERWEWGGDAERLRAGQAGWWLKRNLIRKRWWWICWVNKLLEYSAN